MNPVVLWPAFFLPVGAALAVWMRLPAGPARLVMLGAGAAAALAWCSRRDRLTCLACAAAFAAAGAGLAGDALERAIATEIRGVLDTRFPGFAIDVHGPTPAHPPIVTRLLLTEDAASDLDSVQLRGRTVALVIDGRLYPAGGGVMVTIGGSEARRRAGAWTAGRLVEFPATFRRPARFLNDGVRDFERDLAVDGTTLFAAVKSGLLVEVIARGSPVAEMAAKLRRHVRERIGQWVGRHDSLSAAIVTAILIGDRSGLPDDVRLRLQAAGTYHVIAISGGNIAILTLVTLGLLRVLQAPPRAAALITLLIVVGHACVVSGGASVWRATAMAAVHLAARCLDLRSPSWQALGMAACADVALHPLDALSPGFLLTCGATAALLETGRRTMDVLRGRPVIRWAAVSTAASLAVEVVLLPVNAWTFSRITAAGLLLNLAAVPLMVIAQVSGLVVVILGYWSAIGYVAGGAAHMATAALVDSARVIEWAPLLVRLVGAPSSPLIVAYYASLGLTLSKRRHPRRLGLCGLGVSLSLICGLPLPVATPSAPTPLTVTMFDVGQAESVLAAFPNGREMLIDAAGSPLGSSFDVGRRVLVPALRGRGVRVLDTLVVTHGDPDHIGGAPGIIEAFRPRAVWEGISVPRHRLLQDVLARSRSEGGRIVARRAGEETTEDGVRVRVLHPPPADWERPRVRNDDSVVLELVAGRVAVLLTGDVGAEVRIL